MQDLKYFQATLGRLTDLGVRLALDDFGTGYSSLSRLKGFSFDAMKIDRSFVEGLGKDPFDSALVTAIMAMAASLGMSVTAEGVETEDQSRILRGLNCQQAQGFYLARPMPADSMWQMVAEGRCWPTTTDSEAPARRC